MKRRVFYSIVIFCFGIYFAGQFLTAAANSIPEPVVLTQVETCSSSEESSAGGGEIYFSADGNCAESQLAQEGEDERVPTAIKLNYTGTETVDPVTTTGMLFIFFALVALTIGWLALIRNWNRVPPEF